MIARIQRLLLILWSAALVSTIVAGIGPHTSPAAASAMLALLLSGHALVLAVEFLWMWHVNSHHGAPPITPLQLIRAWWKEAVHAPRVFFWRQPLRHAKWPDLAPEALRDARGVLLVHGYFCNRALWNNWMKKLSQLGVPFIAVDLEPAFGSINAYAPILDEAVCKLRQQTGAPPVVVTHSMGGLAVRRWWIDVDVTAIDHLLTLGTPHHGTRLAFVASTQNARQMKEHSAWLQDLAAREKPSQYAKITCVYSHCDNIVFPAGNAVLAGCAQVHLSGEPHVAMVDAPEVWALFLNLLSPSSTPRGASGPVPCSRTRP